MTATVTERLRPIVHELIEHNAEGERYEWDLALCLVPNAVGGLDAAVALQVWLPAPILGQWVANTLFIGEPHVQTSETLGAAMREAFEAMRNTRTRLLSGGNGGGPG